MAETKKQKKAEKEPEIKKEKIEIIEKEPEEEDDDEEESESILLNQGTSSTFRYPLMRTVVPTIRIQPITAPLEIELSDEPTKKEEDKNDLYKPAQLDKNYSLNQKYELPGGSAYEAGTPKQVAAPVSSSLIANFQDSVSQQRGFGNQNTSTSGYPGQESSERKYDSGLEQQTRDQERRRRTI